MNVEGMTDDETREEELCVRGMTKQEMYKEGERVSYSRRCERKRKEQGKSEVELKTWVIWAIDKEGSSDETGDGRFRVE